MCIYPDPNVPIKGLVVPEWSFKALFKGFTCAFRREGERQNVPGIIS